MCPLSLAPGIGLCNQRDNRGSIGTCEFRDLVRRARHRGAAHRVRLGLGATSVRLALIITVSRAAHALVARKTSRMLSSPLSKSGDYRPVLNDSVKEI